MGRGILARRIRKAVPASSSLAPTRHGSNAASSPTDTDAPSPYIRKKFMEMKKNREPRRVFVNPKRGPSFQRLLWEVKWPMVAVAIVSGATMKIVMMMDNEYNQEITETRIKKKGPDFGKVRKLSREEYDFVQSLPPRTPFESPYDRPDSRLRTGDPVNLDQVKEWSIDMLTDALTKAEEKVKCHSKGKQ